MDIERGSRYEAYSELREKKLLMKYLRQQQQEEKEYEKMVEPKIPTPPRKQVRFQGDLASGRKGSCSNSVLAQSVPDFSAVLRKENRKPMVNMIPSVMELTPPSLKKGSVSASRSGEKRKVFMARKSYASIDELKSFSKATENAINGESRVMGRSSSRVMSRTGFGYRQF
ncbi:hypothetical protein TanjilG_10228 [Lupinus angustifolius]|uniref:Uncharacterized protein n=1 Tax=Lupinus angustifolius TaxID=3871 RepID=A0A4P1RBK4_LUPAN|nr:PREDICTED: uncharacterized protein LOC109354048 [Lupinus angustifolius]OIW07393.1 hypothetical protein TanjilG_10228 [Lupinus angustifolius]